MGPVLNSPYLTPREAAEFLRISERTLTSMRYRDVGPRFRKHGGTVVYHIDDLRAWSRTYDYGSGPKHSEKNRERPSL